MPSTPSLEPPVPSIEAIAGHYDSLDRFYRDIWGEHVHHGLWLSGRESPETAVVQMSQRVLDRLRLAPDMRVADVGCGYGATARLAAEGHGARVVGFTVSAAQKAYADRFIVARGAVDIRLQDWADAEFADGELDAALALESLEHFADKAGFANKMRRAIRPGGRLVIATWLRADKVSPWSQRHLLDALCREGRQPALTSAGALIRTLHEAGFDVVEAEDLTAQVARTWNVIIGRTALRLIMRRQYRKFLFQSTAVDRVFALTAVRIWLAFRTGCFRYGFFTCQ
jgi:tocopherol O-methyltransferase